MTKRKSKKQRGTFGAYGKNHPATVAWRVDADYLDKLTQEEREWYAAFCDKYYGGDFRGEGGGEWTEEEKREAYIDKNRANSDVYTNHQYDAENDIWQPRIMPLREMGGHDVGVFVEDPNRDLSEVPEYLNDPEYKAALAELRRHLHPGRAPREPDDTPELRRAREKVQEIVDRWRNKDRHDREEKEKGSPHQDRR